MYRMFIKKIAEKELNILAEDDTPNFRLCEIMVVEDFNLCVPEVERKYWVEIEYSDKE